MGYSQGQVVHRTQRISLLFGLLDDPQGSMPKALGYRGAREGEYLFARTNLDPLAKIHDGDPVRDMAQNAKVMGNKDIARVTCAAQIIQQIDHPKVRTGGDLGSDPPAQPL